MSNGTYYSRDQMKLFDAIKNNKIDEVLNIISKGTVDLNRSDIYGITPLIYSAMHGHPEIAKVLIENGADVNKAKENGITALHEAAIKGNPEMVRLLLLSGANINALSNNNTSPVLFASDFGRSAVVKILIENGADVNIPDRAGNTPLILAAMNSHVTTNSFTEIVKFLVEAGAQVNAQQSQGISALMLAASAGNLEVIKTLIAAGADINMVNNTNATALMFACEEGFIDIVQTLIYTGANINKEDNYGRTALYFAAIADEPSITLVELLLTYNPNFTELLEKELINGQLNQNIAELLITYYHRDDILLNNIYQNYNYNTDNINTNRNTINAHPINIEINRNTNNANNTANIMTIPRNSIKNTTAFNFIDYANLPVSNLLDNEDILVVKYGPSYFTLYKSQIKEHIKTRENIRFECKEEIGGAPSVNNIEARPYYYIQGTGNFLVKLNELKSAIKKYKIIELYDAEKTLPFVASYSSVQRNYGLGLNGRHISIVSADHCQAGTSQKVYGIKGIDIANTGGKRRIRKTRKNNKKKKYTRKHKNTK